MALPATDTRFLFRPLCANIVDLLGTLGDDDWTRETVAGKWLVRDVVAHLLDTALRRLSFHRDRLIPQRASPQPLVGDALASLIDSLNASWVSAAQRLSPRVLTDLYARASVELADFMESLEPYGDALFPVSWAGHDTSPQWLDIGREFTEVWHHGSQIRDAVGAGPFSDPAWLRAVLQIAMHALPHAYRGVPAAPGASMAIRVTGRAPGTWTLRSRDSGWDIDEGDAIDPMTIVTLSDEVAWRVLFNALAPDDARAQVRVEGDPALALRFLRTRALVVQARR